jgi:hypothetical protein
MGRRTARYVQVNSDHLQDASRNSVTLRTPHSGDSLRVPPPTWAREFPRISAEAATDLIPDNGNAERFLEEVS